MSGQFHELLVSVSQQVAAASAVMNTIIADVAHLTEEVAQLRDRQTTQEVNAKWDGKEERRREKQTESGKQTVEKLLVEFIKVKEAALQAIGKVNALEKMMIAKKNEERELARIESARRWAVWKMCLKVGLPLLGSALAWLVIRWFNG